MLKKEITKEIKNVYDKKAANVEIVKIIEEDNAIICRLLDSDDNVMVHNRVYNLDDIPFSEIKADEKSFINGDEPDDTWSME